MQIEKNTPVNRDIICIVPYNPQWPDMASEEILNLQHLFYGNDWIIDIQHIGSTAIPGLAAKPVIDIYMGAASLGQAQVAIKPLQTLGYQFWEDNPNEEKMFFVRGMPPMGNGRTHHIHIVKHDSLYWKARILFRDYMRTHSEEIPVYANLKYKLREEHLEDREGYSDAKTPYITSVLRKAGFKQQISR
jgi:GrpB-like predicted nucleotidyltransferase (UPF0157 family)